MRFDSYNIVNPKRQRRSGLYDYYAGYSEQFSKNIIATSNLPKDGLILDPWNGGGTTTTASSTLGFRSLGIDINPAMVIVAKANLINLNDLTSLTPILQTIAKTAKRSFIETFDNDPLSEWFFPGAVESFRKVERAVRSVLISNDGHNRTSIFQDIATMSSLSAFYYVGLFKTVREILSPFIGSNPTWIKRPNSPREKLRPSFEKIIEIFIDQTKKMISNISSEKGADYCHELSQIEVGSSDKIGMPNKQVDLVLTSPPYCTRIDYAVATLPELSVLGYDSVKFDALRRSMIGTTTISRSDLGINRKWGITCCQFLENVVRHESKASATYYYKNHLQYFDSIFNSVSEIQRVLKTKGNAVLVVQNSYYKNIHNNLTQIFIEMAEANHLTLIRREDFEVVRAMAGVKYKRKYTVEESVLCFQK